MKNRILSLGIREIKKQFFRYLALLIMSFLGVFVFVGIKATAPGMIKSVDKLYDNASVYDLCLSSSLGFSEESLSEIKSLGLEAYPVKDKDFLFTSEAKEYVINLSTINENINKYTLKEGSYPQNKDEVSVEKNLLVACNLHVGDSIYLNDKSVKIVGVVESSIYINNDTIKYDRGFTNVGSGTINFYGVGSEDLFDFQYYTKIYIINRDATKYITNSKSYLNAIESDKDLLKNSLSEIEEKRTTEVVSLYNEELIKLKTAYNYATEEEKVYLKASITKLEKQIESTKCTINIADRLSYTTYKGLIDDAQSIENLSKVFPIVFYAVALLVSLVSMRRMVTEDRTEIGNLKSMGFSNHHILEKYIIFSLSATIIGGILGAILGNLIIPSMIWNIYKILFSLPKFYITFDIFNILIGILVSTICIVGATVYTALMSLRENPASLLRPKSIPAGKKILLERIKGLWSRLNFSAKVTLRNLFRYKKRGLVTIVGLCGCTALMLCGFGIKNAISDIPSKQYENIYTYDAVARLNTQALNDFSMFEREEIKSYSLFYQESIKISDYDVYLVVIDDYENSKKFLNLYDLDTKKAIDFNSKSLVISDKLADLLNKGIDDAITLGDYINKDGFKITDICENYINHYVYISKDYFEALGYTYEPNIVYFNLNDNVDDDKLKTDLMSTKSLLNVSYTKYLIDQASDMLGSLNNVVIILIVLSMMLSFVVLYNLSNINISERKREIASLKVLGFYNSEVDMYITGENIILTTIGIIFGLVFGYFLTNIVVGTVEIEYVRFIKKIKLSSYIYSALLSALFTIIVNFIAHFLLKRINMIDSLKSVE